MKNRSAHFRAPGQARFPAFRPAWALLALFWLSAGVPLTADTLELRDGRSFVNVKTRVSAGQIYVTKRSGRTQSFSARDVKSIVPEPVVWPERPAPRVKQPKAEVTRPESLPPKEGPKKQSPKAAIRPAEEKPETGTNVWNSLPMRMAEGLVPVWSGLYRRDRPYWGALFSGLELYALLRLLPWLPSGQAWEQSVTPQLGLVSFFVLPPGAPAPPPGAIPPFNQKFFTDTYGLIAAQNLAKHPTGNGSLPRSDYARRRTTLIASLSALLVLDALASGFFSDGGASKSAEAGTRQGAAGPGRPRFFALPDLENARGRGLLVGVHLTF